MERILEQAVREFNLAARHGREEGLLSRVIILDVWGGAGWARRVYCRGLLYY